MVFMLYVSNTLTAKNQKKSLEKDISNAKANDFLSYEKCMQRMKCPVSRKEECSEECKAGNTEEEVEEHQELTIGEHRNSMNKKLKSNKNQHLSEDTQQSTIKTDL